jgi:CBS domain-containing protein
VLDPIGRLTGVVTRRDLLNGNVASDALVGSLICRPPLVVEEGHSLREAADHMVESGVGRLVVVSAEDSSHMIGIITRADLLSAHAQRLREARTSTRHFGKNKPG